MELNGSGFTSDQHTASINGLSASPALLTNNTNSANPFRLDPSQQRTCDITHSYTGEQKEYNGGLMDKFSSSAIRSSALIRKNLGNAIRIK